MSYYWTCKKCEWKINAQPKDRKEILSNEAIILHTTSGKGCSEIGVLAIEVKK